VKLRTRLYIGLTVIAIAFGITGFLVTGTQRRYQTSQVDRQLQSSIRAAMGMMGDRPGPRPNDGDNDPRSISELFLGHLDTDGTLITYMQGRLVSGQPRVTPQEAAAHAGRGFGVPFTVGGDGTNDRFRVVAFQRRDTSSGWDVVALSLARTDGSHDRLLIAMGLGGAVVLVIIGLMGAWVLRLGVRPITEVTAAADAITAGEKGRRAPSFPPRTEAAHLANAFNSMLDQKEQADERLRQFVADASHELRTPLTSIRGYADLYQQGGLRDQARLDDAMRRVTGEAERMSSIVNDLLLLSKLDRGMQLDIQVLDLSMLLDDAAADARAVQPERSVTVTTHRPLHAAIDSDRMRQVLAAVVHNSLLHTPIESAIELRGTQSGASVVIDVVDHGPGMDEHTAARAFERFFRGDQSRTRQSGGSGLGLSIAQSIVQAHGGTITLSTTVEHGSTFRITLPAIPDLGLEMSGIRDEAAPEA
jgi:two-component system OmpR family sensor kinase